MVYTRLFIVSILKVQSYTPLSLSNNTKKIPDRQAFVDEFREVTLSCATTPNGKRAHWPKAVE